MPPLIGIQSGFFKKKEKMLTSHTASKSLPSSHEWESTETN